MAAIISTCSWGKISTGRWWGSGRIIMLSGRAIPSMSMPGGEKYRLRSTTGPGRDIMPAWRIWTLRSAGLLSIWDAGGIFENTWLVFTSDHGEMLGDHNLWRKSYAYDPSARVPLIVVPPAGYGSQRNREVDAPGGWEDIMPTLMESAGAGVPDSLEGVSIIPLLHDPGARWRSGAPSTTTNIPRVTPLTTPASRW